MLKKRWQLWCRMTDEYGRVLSDNLVYEYWLEVNAKNDANGHNGMAGAMNGIHDTGRYQYWYVKDSKCE